MGNHVWLPVAVAIVLVLTALVARFFLLPANFGTPEKGYMYGYHRLANEQEWREMPVRFRAVAGCGACHPQGETHAASPHAPISCQNCHGPALDHPASPPHLAVNTGRDLCLRCHARFAYPAARRQTLSAVAEDHFPGRPCVDCHDPHQPEREAAL